MPLTDEQRAWLEEARTHDASLKDCRIDGHTAHVNQRRLLAIVDALTVDLARERGRVDELLALKDGLQMEVRAERGRSQRRLTNMYALLRGTIDQIECGYGLDLREQILHLLHNLADEIAKLLQQSQEK